MEAEEDLVTRNGGDSSNDEPLGGVTISVEDKTNAKRRITKRKIIRAIFDGSVLLFLGMQVSQKGPSFLDLQMISGTDVEGASSYFTANSFGYIVGALLAGYLYDKVGNKMMLVCLPLTLASFFTGLTPWCTAYATMLVVHMASAFWSAFFEITVTADQFPIWKGKSEAAIQFLGFTYSLGGVLGPLYTEPFLVQKWNETCKDTSLIQDSRNSKTNISTYNPLYSSNSSSSVNQTVYNVGNESHSLQISSEHPESELHYAYMITGLFGILFSIPFYFMCLKNCTKSTNKKDEKDIEEKHDKRLPTKPYVILTFIASVQFFFFTMTEDSFNMFLSMFVVSHLSWTKENGALISSLYWGIGTVSKLIAVPVIRKIDLGSMLIFNSTVMVISMVGFVLASHYHMDICVWVSCSVFGMSQASFFGGCMSWIDIEILHMDGKATSSTLIAGGAGAMFGPLVLGITMESFSSMAFPYIQFMNCLVTSLIFISMSLFLKPYVTRKYGPVRRKADGVNGKSAEVIVDEKKTMLFDDGVINCDNSTV